jgi:peroxiredoxin
VGYAFGVGREAPLFERAAHDGNEISLRQYRGDWLPVVAFVPLDAPGADRALAALSAAADQLWGLRGQVVPVADADVQAVRAFVTNAGDITVSIIPDGDHAIARAYDAWDAALDRMRALACIVDRSGKIVWVGEGQDALKPSCLLDALREVAR